MANHSCQLDCMWDKVKLKSLGADPSLGSAASSDDSSDKRTQEKETLLFLLLLTFSSEFIYPVVEAFLYQYSSQLLQHCKGDEEQQLSGNLLGI